MDKYTKMFIRASVLYLGLGVLFGLYMAVTQAVWDEARFIHVHIMLLGFLAMMIYGVAYHILPRFNAIPMLYPAWVPVHFWLANAGLWGMIITYAMGGLYSDGPLRILFWIFCVIETSAIFIFIINILSVLKSTPAEEPVAPSKPAPDEQAVSKAPSVKISPSMKIAEILEKYPQLEEILAEEGFGSLVTAEAIGTVSKMVSLEMAAKKEDKDLYALIARLEGGSLLKTSDDNGSDNNAGSKQKETVKPALTASSIDRGELATAKTLIGALLETYPETKPVFEKHYGASCFSCPGQQTETIEQTAGMHGMETQKILDEINAIIETVE